MDLINVSPRINLYMVSASVRETDQSSPYALVFAYFART